jgi:hypothetical protein
MTSTSTRYIDIDSTYRDRTRDPLPGQFTLEISQSGSKGNLDARDPVSKESPEFIFTNTLNQIGPTNTITGVIDAYTAGTIGATGSTSSVIVSFTVAANNPFQQSNYYAGLMLQDTSIAVPEEQRIFSSKFLNLSGGVAQVEFKFLNSFSNNIAPGDTILINSPTDITDVNNPIFFLPEGAGLFGDNYYVNCILYNQTRLQSRPISFYDGIKRLLSLDTTGSAVSGTFQGPIPVAWLATDTYVVRKESPCLTGALNNNPNTSLSDFSLPITASSVLQSYKNSFIRITSGVNINEIGRIVNYETLSGNSVGGGINTVLLSLTQSEVSPLNNFYNNMFIQMTSGAANGDVRQVTSYVVINGVTRTLNVTPNFTGAVVAGDSFVFRSGRITPSFPNVLSAGNTFEILCFSNDNFVPMSYSGSIVSQQNEVCYQVELLSLILPNQILASGRGSRITFYPYVYVELQNVSSAGAGTPNIIYSNNPNAIKMLFKAPVDDVPNQITSTFVRIDGHGMVQTIKFKPTDNFTFSVRLSNGDIFETVEPEFLGPSEPNPLIQISALFSIKRL